MYQKDIPALGPSIHCWPGTAVLEKNYRVTWKSTTSQAWYTIPNLCTSRALSPIWATEKEICLQAKIAHSVYSACPYILTWLMRNRSILFLWLGAWNKGPGPRIKGPGPRNKGPGRRVKKKGPGPRDKGPGRRIKKKGQGTRDKMQARYWFYRYIC